MTDKELMQEVLEAMESLHRTGDTQVFDMCAAPVLIPVLRERLAQPEQEPVAYTLNCVCGAVWDIKADGSEEMAHTPDTTPPQRKPLSEEEIQTYRHMIDWTAEWSYINFARAIEAAHGIKGKA